MRHCSIDDCVKKHFSGGMCAMHYQRMYITGRIDLAEKVIRPRVDITGKKYSFLTVLEMVRELGKNAKVRCKCECGGEIIALSYNVQNGNTKSCGCMAKVGKVRPKKPKRIPTLEEVEAKKLKAIENAKRIGYANKTHGLAKTKTYASWSDAKKRCFSPQNKRYVYYGARGIVMCDEWKNSFEAFYRDMGEKPDGKTLDRIEVNGNYEPGNCRWASKQDQATNTRANVTTWDEVRLMRADYDGGMSVKEVAEKYGKQVPNTHQILKNKSWKEDKR